MAHKQAVLGWVEGLAAEAGAEQPGALARSLTLLLDGGLASGALDADPEAARVARDCRPRRWSTRRCAEPGQTVTGRRTRVTRAYQAAVSR